MFIHAILHKNMPVYEQKNFLKSCESYSEYIPSFGYNSVQFEDDLKDEEGRVIRWKAKDISGKIHRIWNNDIARYFTVVSGFTHVIRGGERPKTEQPKAEQPKTCPNGAKALEEKIFFDIKVNSVTLNDVTVTRETLPDLIKQLEGMLK